MKTDISPNLLQICDPFTGILLDAYGVFWGGNDCGLLPGSKEMMETLVQKGKVVGILSNSTQLAAKEITKLARHGLIHGVHFHFLITSGEVARYIFLSEEKLPFETPRKTFWLWGGGHPTFSSHEAIFQGTAYSEVKEIDQADFIFLSTPHIEGKDQIDPDVFRRDIAEIIEKNLPMICPNPDEFAHEGSPPRSVVRQGSIARLYAGMGGRVVYIGKPYDKAYEMALDQFYKRGLDDPATILMVGDTPETDIRGACLCGMSSALVIKTGMMADRIRRQGLEEAIDALKEGDRPDHFIERFGYDIHSAS